MTDLESLSTQLAAIEARHRRSRGLLILGGFAGGYGAGKFLDPLHPERLDHLIGALVCLVATGIAIALSIVYGLPVLRPQ